MEQVKRYPWVLLVDASLVALNATTVGVVLFGPTTLLRLTIFRTWSLWSLMGYFWAPRAFAAELPSALLGRLTIWFLLTLGLAAAVAIGQRFFGNRFLMMAVLLALPLVTIMPGSNPPEEPGGWLAASFVVLWHLALFLAAVEALRLKPDLRGFLWLGSVLAFLVLALTYPLGASLAIALVGVWIILVRRRSAGIRVSPAEV